MTCHSRNGSLFFAGNITPRKTLSSISCIKVKSRDLSTFQASKSLLPLFAIPYSIHPIIMDRGAARSRKRALKLAPTTDTTSSAGPSRPPPSKPLRPQADGDRKPIQDRPDRLSQIKKHRKQRQDNANTDPTKFQPKAIRTAAALIYSKEPFPIPPPKDLLSNVRRIDLEGSGVTDVSFLLGTGVTWLSLKGCEVENGWEAVGSLNELAGEFVILAQPLLLPCARMALALLPLSVF